MDAKKTVNIDVDSLVKKKLERIKHRMNIGREVKAECCPGVVRFHKNRRLKECVEENTIYIYEDSLEEALDLLYHGFAEWILNQHSRLYRTVINRQLELIEDLLYQWKEPIVDALAKLIKEEVSEL